MIDRTKLEIRRDHDGELCGFVDEHGDRWLARTVFGAVLGTHASQAEATKQVLSEGLASLADRWMLTDGETGNAEVVCIQEANARTVTVALGYYSMPGVPTLRIDRAAIDAGVWSFDR